MISSVIPYFAYNLYQYNTKYMSINSVLNEQRKLELWAVTLRKCSHLLLCSNLLIVTDIVITIVVYSMLVLNAVIALIKMLPTAY